MASEKKHYEILVEGDGRGNYSTRLVDVYCTEEELAVVGRALTSFVLHCTDGGCCCLAREGGGVGHGNFDVMFSDCM